MSELIYKRVEFNEVLDKYEDLVVYKPQLPVGGDWGYFGPAAHNTRENQDHGGLIVRARDGSDALGEVVDWEPVFLDIEQGQFSTWRGIPKDQDKYVVIGHVFVTGLEKPTDEQTAGVKAIRRDLISERTPHHLVWDHRLPKAILSLWDIIILDRLHIATGAFVSTGGDGADGLQLGVLRFNA